MLAPLKKNIRIIILLLFGAFNFVSVFAQDDNAPKVNTPFYPWYIDAGGGVIYPLGNKALESNFGSVYSVHASGIKKIYKNLYGGLELQNSQVSQTTSVLFRVAIATVNMFFYNAGLKLAYCSDETSRLIFTGSLVVGKSLIVFNHVSGIPTPPDKYRKEATFFSPRLCESLKVDDELYIGLEATFTYVGYKFDPVYVNILSQTYPPGGPCTFFGWGFNISYLIGKPKI